MRTSTSLALSVAVLGVLAAAPFAPVATSASVENCRTTFTSRFGEGDHWNWTASSTDGGPAWEAGYEGLSRGTMLVADAAGGESRSVRLQTPAVVVEPDSAVSFVHEGALGPGDGLVLEVSTDDGATWTDAGDLLTTGGYDGTIEGPGGARPAWTGARVAPAAGASGLVMSEADLGSLHGQRVMLSWVLVEEATTAAPGTYAALIRVDWQRVIDPDCLDGYATRPWARCLGQHAPALQADTARNDDGTPTWRSIPGTNPAWTTSAAGLGAKDDRLVSEPFTVTPRTRASFTHRWQLEAGRDGATMEYTTDGVTWTDVPADWFLAAGYESTRADGTEAWSETSATHSGWWPTPPGAHWFLGSVVWLGELAGEEVQLRLRLLQDETRSESTPGGDWTVYDDLMVHDTVLDRCPGLPKPVDEQPPACFPFDPPAATSLSTDDPLPLRVHVLLDVAETPQIVALREDPSPGTDAQADALLADVVAEFEGTFDAARPTYEQIGVDLVLTYDVLSVQDGRTPSTTRELIDAAMSQFGGVRPAGVDVVYVGTDDRAPGPVAGEASCIGGLRYDHQAFAAGDLYRGEEPLELLGLTLNDGDGSVVFGHEVAHLLGAQHHFANCAESAPTYPAADDLTDACTLLFNEVSFSQHRLSTVNAMIARGYMEEFAGRD